MHDADDDDAEEYEAALSTTSSPSTVASPTAPQPVFDLMNRPINAHNMDIDIDTFDSVQAKVEGFKEGFRLLPYQTQGRTWMQNMEGPTKAVSGGILADDMGYVELTVLSVVNDLANCAVA